MNESFFGKYSVFCVFGSVVGCVVVPLIAQVVQQQSMECMILSAIFLTFTAARLKKGSNDNPHSKLLLSREYERKRNASQVNAASKKYKTNSNQNHHHNNNATYCQQKNQQQQLQQTDQEYHQKYEHLKIVEMEKKNEEKRLKKLKKREVRLKRKEEELRKQKDIEEKRRRYQMKESMSSKNSSYNPPSSSYHHTVTNNFEKYCCMDNRSIVKQTQQRRKSRTLSQGDQQHPSYKHSTTSSYTARHNIPRFNNTSKRNYYIAQQQQTQPRSTSEALSISCSSNSLSASCSSLSSIGSSGSCSPPPPTSPKSSNNAPAWNKPCRFSDSDSSKSLSPCKSDFIGKPSRPELNGSWSLNGGNITEASCTVGDKLMPNKSHILKSYTNVRAVRNKISTCHFDSSSLFCSTQDQEKPAVTSEELSKGSEYSLFGSHQFGSSFLKSPII